jgi:malonate-semialdehyde dehydrogenase (acetylating) / methylmalonate-semialdehyde dehydrogenase
VDLCSILPQGSNPRL